VIEFVKNRCLLRNDHADELVLSCGAEAWPGYPDRPAPVPGAAGPGGQAM
jgi:hypothetical protein